MVMDSLFHNEGKILNGNRLHSTCRHIRASISASMNFDILHSSQHFQQSSNDILGNGQSEMTKQRA